MSWGRRSSCFAAGLVLLLCLAGNNSLRPSEPARKVPNGPGAELFAGTNVPAFTLEIDSAGMQQLRREPRQWVKATLREGRATYQNVAVHVKGSQGSLQPIDARPALTVSFTRLANGRKFHGLRKIHFNNSAEDPSFMTEILCSELCRAAGLPAARSAHATLTLNGRDLGLYVLKEGLTKDFLGQYFAKTGGNFYDGGFRQDIDQPLERIGGDGPDDQSDRVALRAAARDPNLLRRWKRLQTVLDTDRFISLLAMTTIMWNWDGYPMARNNYRIYHDPSTDRMVFIPHGLDQMFWSPQGTIYPPMQGLVAVSMMQIPEARDLYRQRLATLHTNVLRVDQLQHRIDQLVALIRPYRRDAAQQGARLKNRIATRSASIAQQLKTP
jgi:spore coat protein H